MAGATGDSPSRFSGQSQLLCNKLAGIEIEWDGTGLRALGFDGGELASILLQPPRVTGAREAPALEVAQ